MALEQLVINIGQSHFQNISDWLVIYCPSKAYDSDKIISSVWQSFFSSRYQILDKDEIEDHKNFCNISTYFDNSVEYFLSATECLVECSGGDQALSQLLTQLLWDVAERLKGSHGLRHTRQIPATKPPI